MKRVKETLSERDETMRKKGCIEETIKENKSKQLVEKGAQTGGIGKGNTDDKKCFFLLCEGKEKH